MKVKILAFGIAKEIFGGSLLEVELARTQKVADLKIFLEERFPQLKELGMYMIAVNSEYALADDMVNESDEIAVIPPVSGG